MIDPTPNEQAALTHAGAMGGEMLEEIGETYLAKLSLEQWEGFLGCIVGAYLTRLGELAGRDQSTLARSQEIPF
ncbi:MAG: hypothetical protein PsegKO_34850 [Pseudohongiellaceae bacterium]